MDAYGGAGPPREMERSGVDLPPHDGKFYFIPASPPTFAPQTICTGLENWVVIHWDPADTVIKQLERRPALPCP